MSLQEKMDFLDGVQKEFIPIFDENGNDMNTLCDFWSIQQELKENPQLFKIEDMTALMHMLDDECFECDMMHQLVIIIRRIAVYYGTEGVCFLFSVEGICHAVFSFRQRTALYYLINTYFS